jgi:hypothetical protein
MSETAVRVGERPVTMWWRCNPARRPLSSSAVHSNAATRFALLIVIPIPR